MAYERESLDEVARCRLHDPAKDISDTAYAEQKLSQSLEKLFAAMEHAPEQMKSANVLQLQQTLTELEEALQLARRYYNGTVRELNVKIETFPSNIVATLFHFTPAAYFSVADAAETARPAVTL